METQTSSKEASAQKLSFLDTHSGLQCRDSGPRGAKDIQGKTDLCGFRTRAGGTAVIVLVLSSPSLKPVRRHHLSSVEPSPNITKSEFPLAC